MSSLFNSWLMASSMFLNFLSAIFTSPSIAGAINDLIFAVMGSSSPLYDNVEATLPTAASKVFTDSPSLNLSIEPPSLSPAASIPFLGR